MSGVCRALQQNQSVAEAGGVDLKFLLIAYRSFPFLRSMPDTPLELPLHAFGTENTIVRNIEEEKERVQRWEASSHSQENALAEQGKPPRSRRRPIVGTLEKRPGHDSPAQRSPPAPRARLRQKPSPSRTSFSCAALVHGRDVPGEIPLVLVLNAIHEADLLAET